MALESFNRSFSLNIQPFEDGSFLASAKMEDYFHNIGITLNVGGDDLVILEAEGAMEQVPYPESCVHSLALLQRLVGAAIHRGISKRIAVDLGGPDGCPYLVELGLQVVRFVKVACSTQRARRLILQDGDWDGFRALRANEMGECAGHQNVAADQLPQWLEKEEREKEQKL